MIVDTTLEPERLRSSGWPVVARVIDPVLFYSLLAVIALAAIPYGTVEPWWKALFQCVVFVLAGFSVIGALLNDEGKRQSHQLLLPLLALIAFALVQTMPWSNPSVAGTLIPRTLSADPFQTRLFIINLGALMFVGWLLVRHATTRRRLKHLVDVIIVIGVVSAIFGLWRQASQRHAGFGLPYLQPGYGYGQFINSNHFAFLMELALGLALGIVVCRGVRGRRLALYLIAAVPMWVALVLANSRGGILSILCQTAFLAALFVSNVLSPESEAKQTRVTSRRRLILLRVVLVAILLLGAVVTVVVVAGDPLAGRIDSLSIELDQKTAKSFTLRQNIWAATWELIKDHPVAGVGFGGYWAAIPKYHHGSGEATPQEAHNDYLELLASGGLIGVGIAIWFVVIFVGLARRTLGTADRFGRAATLGALAGILTVAVHSLVDFGLHITINALVFTALVALVIISAGQGNTKLVPEHE